MHVIRSEHGIQPSKMVRQQEKKASISTSIGFVCEVNCQMDDFLLCLLHMFALLPCLLFSHFHGAFVVGFSLSLTQQTLTRTDDVIPIAHARYVSARVCVCVCASMCSFSIPSC